MCYSLSLLVFISQLGFITLATINDTETLHSDVFLNYNRNVRPIYDQSSAINVSIVLYIKSIQDFDEVSGKFSFAAALLIYWHDYRIQWDTHQYGGLYEITVSYGDVWVPELTLSSPSDKAVTIGRASDRIRFNNNGTSQWFPANLIESTCNVNVRNYPFDIQSCTTSFTSLGYKNYEVTLIAGMSTIGFDVYSEDSLWAVIGSETGTRLLASGGESEIFFTIKLKRKSAFVVINVLMPILVLSLLNVFVFALVPESGERIGYCITTLLAIAVYMTIVSDLLPRTSEPVSLISYKLMFDMIISALIVIVTVINMRFQNREDDIPVPKWIESIYRALRRRRGKQAKVGQGEETPIPLKSTTVPVTNKADDLSGKENIELNNSTDNTKQHILDTVTWKKISCMVDCIAIVGFTVLSVISFVVFIAMASAADT